MQKMKMHKKLAAALLATSVIGSGTALAAYSIVPGPKADGTGVTSHGWTVAPAGKQVTVGDKPFGGALTPDHRYLVISNNGEAKSLQVVDVQQQKVVSEVKAPKNQLWFGVAISPDGKTVYASGMYNNIDVFSLDNGTLSLQSPIVLKDPSHPTATISPAGMSVSADGKFLYVADNLTNSISRVDLSVGNITATTPVGKNPYTAFLSHDGSKLYATNWGESTVSILNASDLTLEKTVNVGLHPSAIAENPVNGAIYIANSDSDEISIMDPIQQSVIQTVSLAPYPGAQTGSMPNALTVSPDGKTLYVANSGNNDIAVIDLGNPNKPNAVSDDHDKGNSVSQAVYQDDHEKQKSVTSDVYQSESIPTDAKVVGLIPTAWYPSGIYMSEDGKQLMALNAKGLGYGPNPTNTYIGNLVKGTLSFIDVPDDQQLKKYTKQVKDNNNISEPTKDGWLNWFKGWGSDEATPIPQFSGDKSPIKHVIYILKENRTYDQVLGDLGKGNGDPSLTMFGKTITPNIHKLANQFVTLDNFYSTSEASPDGHYWTNAAHANDHQEKEYRTGDHPYDYIGQDADNYPKEGFLWDNAAKSGVSFRDYGEFIHSVNGINVPTAQGIGNNYDPLFKGWNLNYTDEQRFNEWNNEFQQFVQNGNLPQLEMVLLPGDHTNGTKTGNLTPQAMVAQNDFAEGQIVDAVSHSPYWKDTAIFVVEDDAQDGPDHVESHRTEALVISPYTQTGKVDSTFYDQTSMVRTIEMMLGMKPMSQFDASAVPMLNAFTNHPDFTTYDVEQPQYPLDRKNGDTAPMAEVSQKMDFSQPDANDPATLNRVLWAATMGDKPYPGSKK